MKKLSFKYKKIPLLQEENVFWIFPIGKRKSEEYIEFERTTAKIIKKLVTQKEDPDLIEQFRDAITECNQRAQEGIKLNGLARTINIIDLNTISVKKL